VGKGFEESTSSGTPRHEVRAGFGG